MKEARIIYPLEAGLTAKMVVSIHEITHTFNGATITDGVGYWRHPNGEYIQEVVRIADIAYEPSDENDAKLYDIAWRFREAANQVEVYLRYGNGHVQMVTEKSCMDNGHGHFDVSLSGVLEAVNILTDSGQPLGDRLNAFEYLESSLPKRSKAA